MCAALAAAGARVVVASRSVDRCQALADTLGAGHLALPVDLASAESIRRMIGQAIESMGRLDILVNNGYSGPAPRLSEATEQDFAASLQVGVTGYFVAAQESWRFMRAHGGGSMVNVASMYGLVGSYPDAYAGTTGCSPPNYHAVKGAVLQLTRHLAVYWAADGVRVNALSPGPFPPPEAERRIPEMVSRLRTKSPLGRMGRPQELQGALLLLASEAGSYITGHNLVVDGGWTAW